MGRERWKTGQRGGGKGVWADTDLVDAREGWEEGRREEGPEERSQPQLLHLPRGGSRAVWDVGLSHYGQVCSSEP